MSNSQRILNAISCTFYMTMAKSASHEQLLKYERPAKRVNETFGVEQGPCYNIPLFRDQGGSFASPYTGKTEAKSDSEHYILVGRICFVPVGEDCD